MHSTPIIQGLACGDAVGAGSEFMMPQEASELHAPGEAMRFRDGSPFGFRAGEVTDDTQMALMLLEHATCPDGVFLSRVRGSFEAWVGSHPPDVGLQTSRALHDGAALSWARSNHQSAGNGSLMRVGGLYAHPGFASLNADERQRRNVLAGAVTHLDPRCVIACLLLGALIEQPERQRWSASLRGSVHTVQHTAPGDQVAQLLVRSGLLGEGDLPGYQLRWTAAWNELTVHLDMAEEGLIGNQGGYVCSTLQAAAAHNINAENLPRFTLENVLLPAARLGNDCDSVGAVAGTLAGSRGLSVPDALLAELRLGHSWASPTRRWTRGEPLMALITDLQRPNTAAS